ncbi:MAG: hypothetical protein AAF329_26600 [Cyanobacteria bacterium P01_A01_bin.17]
MSLQDLKIQAMQLPTHERLELISAIVSSLQNTSSPENWQFLVSRPHPWRQQLAVKGRRLLAATIWRDLVANALTLEQAADNWDLPLAAIQEAIHYCETHQDLLKLEAEEEQHRLQERGVSFEPHSAA